MASNAETYRTAMSGYESAIIDEEAAFRRAELSGDQEEMVRASMAIASYRATAREYNSMAAEHAQGMQAARPANAHGLSDQEVEVAKNWTGDNHMTADDKLRIYAENKARYQRMRASGEYRDDQGTVRR